MAYAYIKDDWKGMDPDDIPGYLMDYLLGDFKTGGEIISDETLAERMEDEEWVERVLTNIRNALRADQR